MEAFFHMGGYARFVWPSYGLGLAVILWNIWSARRRHAEALAAVLRQVELQRTQSGRPRTAEEPS